MRVFDSGLKREIVQGALAIFSLRDHEKRQPSFIDDLIKEALRIFWNQIISGCAAPPQEIKCCRPFYEKRSLPSSQSLDDAVLAQPPTMWKSDISIID